MNYESIKSHDKEMLEYSRANGYSLDRTQLERGFLIAMIEDLKQENKTQFIRYEAIIQKMERNN